MNKLEQAIIIALLASLPLFLFPGTVAAEELNKTRLIPEIKNFPFISIPELPQIPELSQFPIFYNDADRITIESAKSEPVVEIAPELVTATKPTLQIPPRTTDKVYMHEPEIRTYICPKLGNRCNTFIAILKAENGTHECTRDNRGLNKNGSIDVGLAQINWNPKHNPPYTFEQLQDCKFNLDVALKKIEARGFQPWYAYTKGAYKKHLKVTAAIN